MNGRSDNALLSSTKRTKLFKSRDSPGIGVFVDRRVQKLPRGGFPLQYNVAVHESGCGPLRHPRDVRDLVASLIGRSGSSVFRLSTAVVSMSLAGSRFSSELGTKALPSEDEVEQSCGRPCRQMNGRSKRPNELTSSIVPRGTSFHRLVELECSPVRFDLARFSCR